MKVAILAGGLGTRLSEETVVKPKPMVTIGAQPILWHIMSSYAAYGFKEFIVALGYKGEVVKDYFVHYHHRRVQSLTVNLGNGSISCDNTGHEDWIVHLLETGQDTQTGGRVKRMACFAGGETFMLTYGDGVSNINLDDLVAFHRQHGKLATVAAVRPSARFGGLTFNGNVVTRFSEKPQTSEGWVNGGFFVLQPQVADYIDGDETIFEREPLERLAGEGQLVAYLHEGFWQCMDTLRDVQLLNELWASGRAPWKVWRE